MGRAGDRDAWLLLVMTRAGLFRHRERNHCRKAMVQRIDPLLKANACGYRLCQFMGILRLRLRMTPCIQRVLRLGLRMTPCIQRVLRLRLRMTPCIQRVLRLRLRMMFCRYGVDTIGNIFQILGYAKLNLQR